MKVPCKDCLTLAICRQKINTTRFQQVTRCPLVVKYVNDVYVLNCQPMYRRARINKVRKQLGLKKTRKVK